MDKNIKQILADLYAVDKSLKKHEPELITIIKNIITSRPEVEYNESFKEELRLKLLQQIEDLHQRPQKNLNIKNFSMNKLFYSLGAVAIVLLLIIIPNIQKNNAPNIIDSAINITKLDNNAFGSITMSDSSNQQAGSEETLGLGGGGMYSASAPKDITTFPHQPIIYQYNYVGDEFELSSDQMPVYKKIKGINASTNLNSLIQNSDFGNIDLSTLSNTKLQNFHIAEDKNYGYSVYVDLEEGMMSVTENWRKWPHPEVLQALTINQVPDDNILISIADNWLQKYKIDLSAYGNPYVENSWKEHFKKVDNSMVPDRLTIIYPQKINDYTVYEEHGTAFGLRVSVNIRENKVSGVWGISTQNYQSSYYEMETNKENILTLAEQGGGFPIPTYEDAEIVEIKLDTPYISYVNTWQQNNGESSQLLVPALVFPVIEKPSEHYFYKDQIIVPLLKNIVEQRLNPDNDIYPMPLR